MLTTAQIDAALPAVAKGLGQYRGIQVRRSTNGYHDDADFRREFNRFYRVRRDATWQGHFFSLMGRAAGLPFADVLAGLRKSTGRVEASFASKLVATIDPSKPVIDAFVLKNLGLRLPW